MNHILLFFLVFISQLAIVMPGDCSVLFGAKPSPIKKPIDDQNFTVAVWLQHASVIYDGKTIAQHYADIGVNTYLGVSYWPPHNSADEVSVTESLNALRAAGITKIYGGSISPTTYIPYTDDLLSVTWIQDHPEFADMFAGYMLGDEPDLMRTYGDGDLSVTVKYYPDLWQARGEYIRSLDPIRDIYTNFGTGFAKNFWSPTLLGNLGSQEADFNAYVSSLSVVSVDSYGITDPISAVENHGIWTYGRSVRNTKLWSGNRPVWAFVEASCPHSYTESSVWISQTMQPEFLMPIIWNQVINGATGIEYFTHRFTPGNISSYGALTEPGMPAAMRAANETIKSYAAIIKAEDLSGTTATTDGAVDVITLTKRYDGNVYIFAQGDGNGTNIYGAEVNATIRLPFDFTGIVNVVNESREINAIGGIFTDHFNPYEVHIYKIF